MLKLEQFPFPDRQYQTDGSNCEMFEIMWQVFILKIVLKCRKGEYMDYKVPFVVLSVMIRYLHTLNYISLGPELFTFIAWTSLTVTTETFNSEGQRF